MKKIILILFCLFTGIGLVNAGGKINYNGNSILPKDPNDKWTMTGYLNIQDSQSQEYKDGLRGELYRLKINSELFGDFTINNITLKKSNKNAKDFCGEENTEVFSIEGGDTNSEFWGDMSLDTNNSFFCSNELFEIYLESDQLGIKLFNDSGKLGYNVFDKQKIFIQGLINKDGKFDILATGDDSINKIGYNEDSIIPVKTSIYKNIDEFIASKYPENSYIIDKDFNGNSGKEEKLYYYDYSDGSNDIKLGASYYINKGKILEIGKDGNKILKVSGKNAVIVKSGNIYINSNISNTDDKKSLLILVALRDKEDGKGGNIYINPDVTNIDAVLIADGSLISYAGGSIQKIQDLNQLNNLRKQLLIYGSVLSSNTVGSDEIPYGADYYESSVYPSNTMSGNIYDLANLRYFNTNYPKHYFSECLDNTKLVPIDGSGSYLKNAWAGRKECYNDDAVEPGLRGSDKKNPLIIKYNSNIQRINTRILSSRK